MLKLKKVTEDNWKACIELSVKDEQKKWIPANCYSLLEAQFGKHIYPLIIEVEDKVIGLLLYDRDPETKHWELRNIMINQDDQGKGYGKDALNALIKKMHREHRKALFYTYISPDNEIAIKTYEGVGFVKTGENQSGKDEYSLQL